MHLELCVLLAASPFLPKIADGGRRGVDISTTERRQIDGYTEGILG